MSTASAPGCRPRAGDVRGKLRWRPNVPEFRSLGDGCLSRQRARTHGGTDRFYGREGDHAPVCEVELRFRVGPICASIRSRSSTIMCRPIPSTCSTRSNVALNAARRRPASIRVRPKRVPNTVMRLNRPKARRHGLPIGGERGRRGRRGAVPCPFDSPKCLFLSPRMSKWPIATIRGRLVGGALGSTKGRDDGFRGRAGTDSRTETHPFQKVV